MPIKYIGRKTDFSGKTLWEIVGNLKNFGLGRLVKRNMFERYPEPSFFRICKVETVDNEEGEVGRRVRVWVEKVWRGRRYPELVEMFRTSYKTDYRLVPRDEEKALWAKVEQCQPRVNPIPPTKPFPPLLQYLMTKQTGERPELKLQVRRGRDNVARVTADAQFPQPPPHQRPLDL